MNLRRPEPKPWMNAEELMSFKRHREAGAITFFRTALCKAPKSSGGECGVEIPKDRQWCSRKCFDAAAAAEKAAQLASIAEAAERLRDVLAPVMEMLPKAADAAGITPLDPVPDLPLRQMQLPLNPEKKRV